MEELLYGIIERAVIRKRSSCRFCAGRKGYQGGLKSGSTWSLSQISKCRFSLKFLAVQDIHEYLPSSKAMGVLLSSHSLIVGSMFFRDFHVKVLGLFPPAVRLRILDFEIRP